MVISSINNKYKPVECRGCKLVSWVFASVILLNFFYLLAASGEPNSYVRMFNAIVGILSYLFICRSSQDNKNASKLLLVTFIFWGFSVFAGIINGASSIFKPVLLFDMLFGISYAYIVATKRIILFPIKVVFLLISIYLAYLLLVLGVETTEIFSDSAGGMIGTTLLSIAVLIQFVEYRDNNKIPILPSLITLFLCIFSYSRASILCALVYFLAVLFFATRNINNRLLRDIPFIIILSAIVYFVVENWELIETLDMYEKFERKGIEADGRGDIWMAYLGNLDLGSFFFGRTLDHEHKILGFDNPHNIIIRLHSQFGILSFLVYYFIVVAVIKLFKKNPFVSFLLGTLVLRGMFDIAYFFDVYDYIILALIFEKYLKIEKIKSVRMALI